MTVRLDDDTPPYPISAMLTQEQVALVSDSGVSNYFLLAPSDVQDPLLVPVTIGEMLQKEQTHHFC